MIIIYVPLTLLLIIIFVRHPLIKGDIIEMNFSDVHVPMPHLECHFNLSTLLLKMEIESHLKKNTTRSTPPRFIN